MNHKKVTEMIQFSFFKNMQNKWFLLFNILSLIGLVIALNWNSFTTLFQTKTEENTFQIAFLDSSQLAYEDFLSNLQKTNSVEMLDSFPTEEEQNASKETEKSDSFIAPSETSLHNQTVKFEVVRISENTYTAENIPDKLAVIEITADEQEGFQTSIISKEGINTKFYTPIKEALTQARNQLLAKKHQISSDELQILQSDLTINRVMLSVNAEDSDAKELIKLFSSAITYLLSILIFSKIANEIAQEKQSKSSEYILTTVSAKEYLFAKIFSNIAILLVQGIFLFVYYFIAIAITNLIHISLTDITLTSGILKTTISLDTIYYILALLVYSVLNLVLLCIIQATLSAKTASTAEAGNTVSLLTFLMMAAYIATVAIITPYTQASPLLYFLSCLPILSAYFVPGMMVVGQATTWQIVISLLILILSIPISFHFCSKSFKNGILDYTKRKKVQTKEENWEQSQSLFFTKRSMRNVGFVVGLGILLYIGIQSVVSLLSGFLLPALLGNHFTETDLTLINQLLLQVLSLGIASSFVLSYCERKEETPKEIQKGTKIKLIFIGLFFMSALQILLSFVIYPAIGLDYNITDMFEVSANSSFFTKIILVLSLAVVPAIFEELFFRKALIDFTAPYSKKFALLFSALLFGFLHMNLSQGLFAFLIGIVLGGIYLYTNDIKLPILIHFINNGLSALSMIVPDLGVICINLLFIAFIAVGFVFFFVLVFREKSRQKIFAICQTKYPLKSIANKYIYLFTDFSFDISLILIALMSVLTENILR